MGQVTSSNKRVNVKNQATVLGQFSIFNFTGAGVVATDAGNGQVDVTIAGGAGGSFWKINGNLEGVEKYIGTNDNFDFPIYTNGLRRGTWLKSAAKLGIGTATPGTTLDLVSDNTAGDVDVLSLRSTGVGVTPATQTGVMFYVWVNSFQNNTCCRIYNTYDSINVIDARMTFQSRDGVGSFIDTLSIQNGRVGIGSGNINPLSVLDVAGSVGLNYKAKTANYTLTINDCSIDCTSGTFTVTFPTAVGIAGRIYQIKNSGSGVITFAGNTAQTFDGVVSPVLNNLESVIVQSNGANWIVISSVKSPAINAQTASYTLVLKDKDQTVEMNVAGANNLTIPTNASVAFPINTQIIIYQKGAGQTTFVASGGVTLNSFGAATKLSGQYAAATLIKVDTNVWLLSGNITT